jgi:amino acid adenylation domain-containing protein
MTLMAAYQVLLYRHSGQRELIVGSPTTGRSRAEFTGIVGYFVNPVAMRASLSDEETFGALLGNVRRNVLSAFENQDCPFSHLVERLRLVRDPARSPLFQTMFILQKAPFLNEQGLTSLAMCEDGASLQWAGYDLEVVGLEQRATQFDLTLMMAETAEGLTVSFEYNTDLFNASTIERLGAHFQTLLESIVSNPEQRISELEMLDEAARHQLLVEFNDTVTAYPQAVCLHQLFEQQVERTPAAFALSFADEHLTYAELNGRANQLAHYLQEQGVELEDRVGVLLERSVEMVIALLAILKTGAAYVPLDPAYPAERLCFMSEDARLRVLLTDTRLREQVSTAATAVLCLDQDWANISAQPRANLERAVPANALAYVIYTSGSTGQPKGAMNTHGGIVNRLRWMQDAYQLTAADRVLQKTPFSFDVSVWEFFWPLAVGAGLCVAVPGGHQDAGYLRQVIAEERITTIHFVPSMLQAFVQEPEVWRCGQQLKRVICSGEALGVGLQERFFAELAGVELHNLYGPTEAAVDVTSWECRRGAAHTTVPIGRPIANTQVYILGEGLELVALGVRGEVYLGGEGLARGYLNKPELTAERFIPHPYSAREGARLYRTGDIGRYLADGNIEYLGRADHQVKLRGFRIELGEIESVLSQHPQVREAVVVAQETAVGQKRLVGYVVTEAGAELSTSELRQHLAEKLPEHMIPALLVQLEELPLTPNGKVDRRALPGPDTSHPNQTREYEAPRTPYEEALCAIWQQVLGLDRVGIHDNFFELGGHSLLATQVMSRLREAFQVDLPLRVIFEAPTVTALAERMTRQLSTAEILEVLRLSEHRR